MSFLPWPPSVHSASLSIKAITAIFVLLVALLLAVLPSQAQAQSSVPGVTCSMINGVYTCSNTTGPPGVSCSMVQGVYVCTDGSTGSSGSQCITEVSTGKQTCLTNGGGTTTTTVGQLGRGFGKVADLPQQVNGTGWLSKMTAWIANVVHTFFTAIVQVLKDLVTYVLSVVLGLIADAIASITPPDFLTTYSMGTVLGQAGPIVGFFLVQFRIGEGLALIGAGYAFRLLRKFLTLFQW